MSTAVIISGQMRTFARCYPTQRWQVFRPYHCRATAPVAAAGDAPALQEEPHFFVSCVDDENAHTAELLRQHYANVHIEKFTDPTDLPEVPIEYGAHAPYTNAATHAQLMLQHWTNKQAWQFFRSCSHRPAGGSETSHSDVATIFDTIIRIRPDILFHRFNKPRDPLPGTCLSPWWGKFGGINDRFAIMGPEAAAAYFNMYDRINDFLAAGCPFHPESLVAAVLREANIVSHTTLLAHFSTLRSNGDQRWPEIAAEDIAELIANR